MVAKKKTSKKKATKTVAVAKTTETALSAESQDVADLYSDDQDDITSDDLLISRCLLMQPPSGFVADGKAQQGQIVGSVEADLLADRGETIEFIPIHRHKSFRLFKPAEGGGKPTFIKEVPYDQNTVEWESQRLREVEIDGETLQVFISWNYYVMLVNDLGGLPRMISFSSTSFKTGKKLGTFTVQAKKAGKHLPFKTYKVGAEQVTNDKGNFFVFTVEKGRDTTTEEINLIAEWAKMAKAGNTKVHDAEDNEGLSDSGGVSAADAANTDAF